MDSVPRLLQRLLEAGHHLDRGVGMQHVQAAEVLHGPLDHRAVPVPGGDVEWSARARPPASSISAAVLDRRLVDVDTDDRRALLGEGLAVAGPRQRPAPVTIATSPRAGSYGYCLAE